MYVCMYVCMCVCIMYVYIHNFIVNIVHSAKLKNALEGQGPCHKIDLPAKKNNFLFPGSDQVSSDESYLYQVRPYSTSCYTFNEHKVLVGILGSSN